MKHRMKRQKSLSTFDLKQQFIGLLASEFENCGFDIVLGFESSFNGRICTLKFIDDKRIEVYANLGYVKKSVCVDGCSQMFKVHYCTLFIAEYIKHIERAKNNIPQSYFDGLAFLNAIEVYKSEKTVSVYSPLSHWDRKPKHSFNMRPLEISCAINALNRIRLSVSLELSKQEQFAVKHFCDSLLLYASLPEISYVHTRIPAYTLADSLKRLANLISKEPELVQEFPVLALARFEHIMQLTVNDLFLHCIQSDNEFLTGVSIRIIAFLHPSHNIQFTDDVRRKLTDVLNEYIDYGITYCKELSKPGRCLLNDNLFAVKTAVKSINDYLTIYGTGVIAGNIHSII